MKVYIVYGSHHNNKQFWEPIRENYSLEETTLEVICELEAQKEKFLVFLPAEQEALNSVSKLSLEQKVFIFGDYSEIDEKLKKEVLSLHQIESVSGFIDLRIPLELQIDFLELATLNIMDMNKHLTGVINFFQKDLLKFKKLHEKMVPLRQSEFKGISVSSKFAAGEASGGEFFDVCSYEKNIIILLLSTNSYKVSSQVLSEFELMRLKKSYSASEMQSFVKKMHAIDAQGSQGTLECILLDVCANDLDMTVYSLNSQSLLKFSENRDIKLENLKPIDIKLKRGEKIDLISTGFQKGFKTQEDSLDDYYQKVCRLSAREYLTEMFFAIKKDASGPFIGEDASLVRIEVGKNVIVKA